MSRELCKYSENFSRGRLLWTDATAISERMRRGICPTRSHEFTVGAEVSSPRKLTLVRQSAKRSVSERMGLTRSSGHGEKIALPTGHGSSRIVDPRRVSPLWSFFWPTGKRERRGKW